VVGAGRLPTPLAALALLVYDEAMKATFVLAVALLLLGGVTAFWAQDLTNPPTPPPVDPAVYVCPMDPDVRSSQPGTCPRCGMKLTDHIPDAVEYHLDVSATPRVPHVGEKVDLRFDVHDPWKDRTVSNFQIVHEKPFHMFVVSQDMEFFLHDHPVWDTDHFHYQLAFPRPGLYRVVGDFYPDGATPQLIPKTVIVPGGKDDTPMAEPTLTRDYSTKTSENLEVALVTDPPVPIAGQSTRLHFRINPGDGFEKLLGAWGHMLVASDDLIDMMHTHPFIADGGPQIQFNVTFPRPTTYRVWVQFQRNGVINTVHFDLPVEELK
jgi:hypothetical protein